MTYPYWSDAFDEMLDETHEPVRLFGMTFQPSYALRELDPVAYRVEFSDWIACGGLTCSECSSQEAYPDVCLDDPYKPPLCDDCQEEAKGGEA